MPPNRVRIDQQQAELVKSLLSESGNTAPFQTYADVLVFAAALGVRYQWRTPITTTAKEPTPINLDIFVSRGYDWLIQLIAIATTNNPKILSLYDNEAENERLRIFEEYANGGLIKLRDELKGSVDYSETIALLLNQERHKQSETVGEFDLTRFL
ncbi:MAG: DNA phosphorothioation-associated protein 4 [Gloeocapsa sp. DLM2.Bin57]|nr:MAG: DNA phosphorothioation-associated protein 4 [Gloeocapsa sp. DLM2.Bin57]